MFDSGWIFLYTPVPWLVAICLLAYRHDLGRLIRPFRDRSGLNEWWSVCQLLGLVKPEAKKLPTRWWGQQSFAFLAGSITVSLLWLPFRTLLPWYGLCVLQTAAAFPLSILVFRWVGPLPYGPFRDVLPYPRLGTRVRHLEESAAPTTERRAH